MTHIPAKLHGIGLGTTSDAQPKARRHPATGNPADFQKTLDTMRQAIDLAMAERFLNVSMSWEDQEDEERPGGGIGLNAVGMNMLATLAKLQVPQDTGRSPGSQPHQAAPAQAARQPSVAAKAEAADRAGAPAAQAEPRQDLSTEDMAGALARMFESGGDGSQAIGWDHMGGTSYGMFQLSSRQGTMGRFLAFLDGAAPELATRLRKAGPADTGSRNGAMPREWRAIAAENPQRFEALQHRFISQSHYQPAMQAVLERTGLDVSRLPKALQEVLFSTAVQHGPTGAADIFAKAASGLDGVLGEKGFSGENIAEHLIREVYMQRSTRFGSSTSQVQAAVRNRLKSEHKLAMNILGGMDTEMA